MQRDAATQRVAEEVGPFVPEMRDERGDVIRELLETEGAVDVGGVPMPLQLDSDDLPGLGQGRQERPEHTDGAKAAVDEHQWPPYTVDFVIHLQAVHWRIADSCNGGRHSAQFLSISLIAGRSYRYIAP